MRFGIISDIHANIEALTVALEVLEQEGTDQIICLGDVIGYNASPKECLELIIEKQIPTIKGNHERYVVGEIPQGVKSNTIRVAEWTKEQLGESHIEFVENMPNRMLHESGFLITHGSPRNKDEYLLKLNSFIANLKLLETKYPEIKVCFHGHTHVPSVWGRGHIVQNIHEDRTVELERDKTYLINPGSVGQPRDRCPLSSFGIFDDDDYTFTFFRREYDIASTQEKLHSSLEFATKFAERLATGT